MHTKKVVIAAAALLLAGCAAGEGTQPPRYDKGAADQAVNTDTWSPYPDTGPLPDHKVTKQDTGAGTDGGLCGNGKVEGSETCDKKIAQGKTGACPGSASDCDDKNSCTNDSVKGSAASCTAECVHTAVTNCCGNGTIDSGEACDDGNVFDKDGCNNQCKLPGGHLLITEIVTTPAAAEFVEIYNPSSTTVDLTKIFIADRNDYLQLPVKDGLKGQTYDFVATFPSGATLAPGAYAVIAIQGTLNYKIAFGKSPDYELQPTDAAVPDMVEAAKGTIASNAGLTDGGEPLILFAWDGSSDLVQDLDYALWGSAADAVSKSTICVDGPDPDTTKSCYKNDTPPASQAVLAKPSSGGSLHRCNYLEAGEKTSGGNGASGHDETSEPLSGTGATWKRNTKTLKDRTPGAPAPPLFCP